MTYDKNDGYVTTTASPYEVSAYEVPTDPMDDLQCESCQ